MCEEAGKNTNVDLLYGRKFFLERVNKKYRYGYGILIKTEESIAFTRIIQYLIPKVTHTYGFFVSHLRIPVTP